MSSGSAKVHDYYGRGGKALSIQDIESVLDRYPRLAPPRNILVLDGVVDTGPGVAVGLTPSWESTMILTPLANQETVAHEYMHEAFGLGEIATRLLTPVFRLRGQFTLFPRKVQYRECARCETHPEYIHQALQAYGLQPEFSGMPNIRHYTLVEPT